MLSAFAELVTEGIKHRRAVKDIMKLCDVFDLNPEDTRIWAELKSMYSPVIPTSSGESAFAEAYAMSDKESRCWGYLQYMIAEGDVTTEDIRCSLETFTSFEKLASILGLKHLGCLVQDQAGGAVKHETSDPRLTD